VLVQGVANDQYALGYFGYAYYVENKARLKAVPVVAAGAAVGIPPSPENVENGTYQPLSRPIFIYVNAALLQKPEVREFVTFYLASAKKLVAEVKYIPLPTVAYVLAQARVSGGHTGTAFDGHSSVGIRADELFRKTLKN